MNNINNDIIQTINGILLALRTKGINKISATKLLLLINEKYRVELDMNSLSDILSNKNNQAVASMNGDQIMLGSSKSMEQEENDDTVHNMAVKQASDNLTKESFNHNYKQVFEKYLGLNIGQEITLKKELNENIENYHLLKGIKKSQTPLIIEDFLPKNNIQNSKVRCKIKNKHIYVELPVTLI